MSPSRPTFNSRLIEPKGLADVAEGDAFGFQSSFEALNWFGRTFLAENKCLVVDGQDMFRAAVIRHGDGLFGRAMGVDPGLVRANRHERQSEGTFLSDCPKG